MILTLISFVLAVINLAGMYFISHHKPLTGWRVVLALQVPWLAYNMVVHQWAFLFMTVVNGLVAVKSIRTVRKNRHAGNTHAPRVVTIDASLALA